MKGFMILMKTNENTKLIISQVTLWRGWFAKNTVQHNTHTYTYKFALYYDLTAILFGNLVFKSAPV